jgi:hypothetical protein
MGTAVRWLNEEDINVYFGKKQNRWLRISNHEPY